VAVEAATFPPVEVEALHLVVLVDKVAEAALAALLLVVVLDLQGFF
jgi:hypothetical protein